MNQTIAFLKSLKSRPSNISSEQSSDTIRDRPSQHDDIPWNGRNETNASFSNTSEIELSSTLTEQSSAASNTTTDISGGNQDKNMHNGSGREMTPVPRKKLYHFRKRQIQTKRTTMPTSDLSDDSGDELYKPSKKDLQSSDSDMTSERDSASEPESLSNIQLVKPKKRHRDKNWKRKGKSLKKKFEKKRKIVHATSSQSHRSGPWKIREKENNAEAITSTLTETEAIRLSQKSAMNRTILLKYHTIRLDNLLLSNGLKKNPKQ
ncbi:unnamed protein product [Mytilus edulis]|uniref:Uncharacterized protein n=1 Tax=Mytilus edulis TaxID=6550 RepID=A0A8S3SIG6_MYTED|nr:unnamed protein product [Mytilus edulis]